MKKLLIASFCLFMALGACQQGAPENANNETAAPEAGTDAPSADMGTGVEPAGEAEAEIKELVGTFEGYEFGDYFHVDIKKDDGEVQSFYMFDQVDVDFESLEKGTKVQVLWSTSKEYLESAGGEMEVDKIVGATLVQ